MKNLPLSATVVFISLFLSFSVSAQEQGWKGEIRGNLLSWSFSKYNEDLDNKFLAKMNAYFQSQDSSFVKIDSLGTISGKGNTFRPSLNFSFGHEWESGFALVGDAQLGYSAIQKSKAFTSFSVKAEWGIYLGDDFVVTPHFGVGVATDYGINRSLLEGAINNSNNQSLIDEFVMNTTLKDNKLLESRTRVFGSTGIRAFYELEYPALTPFFSWELKFDGVRNEFNIGVLWRFRSE